MKPEGVAHTGILILVDHPSSLAAKVRTLWASCGGSTRYVGDGRRELACLHFFVILVGIPCARLLHCKVDKPQQTYPYCKESS